MNLSRTHVSIAQECEEINDQWGTDAVEEVCLLPFLWTIVGSFSVVPGETES